MVSRIHLHEVLIVISFIETGSRMVSARSPGGRRVESYCLMNVVFQFYKMERILRLVA